MQRRFFLVDKFMDDCNCSYIQACIAAEDCVQGKQTRAQSVREWNPNGPDRHVGEYFIDSPMYGAVEICDEDGNVY